MLVHGYLPTHWRFLCIHPSPPLKHGWREPCNNLACFHDNHLLLSYPHLSTSPFLPLSCLPPLCILLVFQGQRGSQPDRELKREIQAEWRERAITGGENADRGRLEDKNPPDVVIVGTLDLRQSPHSTCPGTCALSYHNLLSTLSQNGRQQVAPFRMSGLLLWQPLFSCYLSLKGGQELYSKSECVCGW